MKELSLLRRDISKMVETGVREGVPADWPGDRAAYRSILAPLPRGACREIIVAVADALQLVHTTINDQLVAFVITEIFDGNAAQDERLHVHASTVGEGPFEEKPRARPLTATFSLSVVAGEAGMSRRGRHAARLGRVMVQPPRCYPIMPG